MECDLFAPLYDDVRLATEILVSGGTMEDVANILGDSETVCRKHYIRWCPQYQARISEVFDAVHATISRRKETEDTNWKENKDFDVVARDGIEPPTRGFSVRCSTN